MPATRTHAAVEGFDRHAEEYDRGRPEYPPDALAFLAQRLRLPPDAWLVELGSGTGKLTKPLRSWGARLLAVEPTRGMREVFRRALPDVPLLAATAERLPLRDGAARAVVVAQAFHWFRQPEATDELRRVVAPGGAVALLWNLRDESSDWMAALGALIERSSGRSIPRSRDHAWRRYLENAPGFGPIEERTFVHHQRADVPTVVDRVLSISAIGLRSETERATIAEEVRTLLATHPATRGRDHVDLPYRTEAFVVPRVSS